MLYFRLYLPLHLLRSCRLFTQTDMTILRKTWKIFVLMIPYRAVIGYERNLMQDIQPNVFRINTNWPIRCLGTNRTSLQWMDLLLWLGLFAGQDQHCFLAVKTINLQIVLTYIFLSDCLALSILSRELTQQLFWPSDLILELQVCSIN